jgi:hypothetical protein
MTWVPAWQMVVALAVAVLLLGVGPRAVRAQDGAPPTTAEAMQQMGFLVGQFQGDGWIELAPGRRVPFAESETVTWKLDGLALLIEGRGTQPTPVRESVMTGAGPIVVHEALAVLTYDAGAQRYGFRAYQGTFGATSAVDADASLVDGALVWGFQPNPDAPLSIRYTITVSEAGEWVEVGELAPDGQTWRTFFMMTLQRQAAAE